MKLKTDASGNAVVQDGKVVCLDEKGEELQIDVVGMHGQMKQLRDESRDKRLENKELKAKLEEFAGIDNPKAAREALEVVGSIEGKTKADMEKMRAEVSKSWETKLAEEQKARQALESQLHRELIGGGVARSKFAAEKSALPADLLLKTFGDQFTVENGVVVGKRSDGTPIYSRANPGQLAGLDEALETLVSESPHRDHILKATAKGGSGAVPGTGGAGGTKQMTTTAFDALSPKDRAARMADGYVLTD